MEKIDYLFVYETLKSRLVRDKIVHEDLQGTPAILSGYREVMYHGQATIKKTLPSRHLHGEVLEVTPQDLRELDDYEGSSYMRIRVRLEDGKNVWVYKLKKMGWGEFHDLPKMEYIPDLARKRNAWRQR